MISAMLQDEHSCENCSKYVALEKVYDYNTKRLSNYCDRCIEALTEEGFEFFIENDRHYIRFNK